MRDGEPRRAVTHGTAAPVAAGRTASRYFAKERGAHVTGTASAPEHGFPRELGADAFVDHRSADFTGTEERYDVVLDTLGGETATRSVGVLRPGGVLVSLMPGALARANGEAAERDRPDPTAPAGGRAGLVTRGPAGPPGRTGSPCGGPGNRAPVRRTWRA
ncbi:zinc-binding dehydrogenase [Streptomyces sp. NRRL F-5135]|uniref:zinc-binding dehydrogenase n=1 Tax=Streptomyces sp. NRRL F-5135 TaxID=1463858 RepID=UPI0004CA50B5